MESHRPSRRQLLGGLVAGLLSWCLAPKSQAAPQPPAQPPMPPAVGPRSGVTTYSYDGGGPLTFPDPAMTVWRYTYDGQDRLICGSDPGCTTVMYESGRPGQ